MIKSVYLILLIWAGNDPANRSLFMFGRNIEIPHCNDNERGEESGDYWACWPLSGTIYQIRRISRDQLSSDKPYATPQFVIRQVMTQRGYEVFVVDLKPLVSIEVTYVCSLETCFKIITSDQSLMEKILEQLQ